MADLIGGLAYYYSNPAYQYNGKIDELRIYDRVLFQDEIRDIYECARPPEQENQAPVAVCRNASVTLDANGRATIDPSLIDGGSSDPDGDPIELSADPTSHTCAELGDNTVTLTATDPEGASDSCEATLTMVDATPPAIQSASADPGTLWPPNNKMRPVSVSVRASDNCDPEPACAIQSAANDETGGADAAITGDLSAELRAARSGAGEGRAYSLSVACADHSGNESAPATATVLVPHDQGRGSMR
ncbi:MAG: hypothetical protein ABII00_05605 [Elusimicrobiota bacterium]